MDISDLDGKTALIVPDLTTDRGDVLPRGTRSGSVQKSGRFISTEWRVAEPESHRGLRASFLLWLDGAAGTLLKTAEQLEVMGADPVQVIGCSTDEIRQAITSDGEVNVREVPSFDACRALVEALRESNPVYSRLCIDHNGYLQVASLLPGNS